MFNVNDSIRIYYKKNYLEKLINFKSWLKWNKEYKDLFSEDGELFWDSSSKIINI